MKLNKSKSFLFVIGFMILMGIGFIFAATTISDLSISTGDLNIAGDINSDGDINGTGDLNIAGDINSDGDINVTGDINVNGNGSLSVFDLTVRSGASILFAGATFERFNIEVGPVNFTGVSIDDNFGVIKNVTGSATLSVLNNNESEFSNSLVSITNFDLHALFLTKFNANYGLPELAVISNERGKLKMLGWMDSNRSNAGIDFGFYNGSILDSTLELIGYANETISMSIFNDTIEMFVDLNITGSNGLTVGGGVSIGGGLDVGTITGSGSGGDLTLKGDVNSPTGGDINFNGGIGGNNGGSLKFITGTGNNNAGDFEFTASESPNSEGGKFTFIAGLGAPEDGSGAGGGYSFTAGDGGFVSGDGGSFVFTTGSTQGGPGSSGSFTIDIASNSGGDVGNIILAETNGNVGIGTTSPTEKLDVNGSVNISGVYYGDGSGLTGVSGGIWTNSSGDATYVDGRVGIGTSTPTNPLSIGGGADISGNLKITDKKWIGVSDKSSRINFDYTVNATNTTVSPVISILDANLGVRNPNAVYALDVAGDIRTGRNILQTTGGTFAAKVDYVTEGGPHAVAIGDVNNDGYADLITTNLGNPDYVSVYINNKDGTFAAKVNYAAGGDPFSVDIGDVNNDGYADIVAIGNALTVVSIFINNGDGTFATRVDYTTANSPYSVAIGDIDNDGYADLAVVSRAVATVSAFINNGDGTFATRVDYTTGTTPRSVDIGDVNNDGYSDLAVANDGANSVSVLINNKDGTFATKADYTTGTDPRSVVIGDMNNDGYADLATSNIDAASVSVLINDGDGTFATKADYTTGTNPRYIAIGDVDNDGYADLATANDASDNISVLINDGDGTFAAKADYITASGPRYIAIGDVDNDGYADLAVANVGSDTVSVFINQDSTIFIVNKSNNRIGIGTSTPMQKLDVNGSVNVSGNLTLGQKIRFALGGFIQNIVSGRIDINGTLNVTGGLNVDNDTLFVDSSTNEVGIGTTNPDNKLHVYNAALQVGNFNNIVGNRLIIDADGNIEHTRGLNNGSDTSARGRFQILNNVASAVESGNDAGGFFVRNNNGRWAAMIGGGGSVLGGLKFYTGGTSTNQVYDTLSASLAMTIDQNGNVGIGTSSPTQKLDVNGSTIIRGNLNVTGTSYLGDITIDTDNITVNGVISKDGNISFYNSSGSEKVRITSEGKVGIGTTTPTATLEIGVLSPDELQRTGIKLPTVGGLTFVRFGRAGGGADELFGITKNLVRTSGGFFRDDNSSGVQSISFGADGSLGFETENSTVTTGNTARRLTIAAEGNVGIGTSSPTQKLDVNGSLNVSGNLTLGQKITFAFGEVIDNIVDGWIRITGSLNVTQDVTIGNDLNVTGDVIFEKSLTIGNTVYVNSVSDFPVAVDGRIQLENDTLYIGKSSAETITLTDILVYGKDTDIVNMYISTNSSITALDGQGVDFRDGQIIYTGTETLFVHANSGGITTFKVATIILPPLGGTVFDWSGDGGSRTFIVVETMAIVGTGGNYHIGNISNTMLAINSIQSLSFSSGFVFKNTSLLILNTMTFSGDNSNSTFLSFEGDSHEGIFLSNFNLVLQSNEYALSFNNQTTFGTVIVSLMAVSGFTDKVFEPGSFDQTTLGFKFIGNSFIPDSTVKSKLFFDTAANITTITSQGVFEKLVGTWEVGISERFNQTADGNMTYIGFEDISVLAIARNNIQSGANLQEVAIKFYKNGVPLNASKGSIIASNIRPSSVYSQDLIDLSTGDVLTLYVANEDGVSDITLLSSNIILSKV